MTRIVRWHYLGSIAISTVFLFGALAASWHYQISSVQAQVSTLNNIGGWAWSGNSGYISLNSLNMQACINNPSTCLPYGLNLTVNPDKKTGVISGWAWSNALGWVCFGGTCALPSTPGAGLATPTNILNPTLPATFSCTGSTCTAGDEDKLGKRCFDSAYCGVGGSCSAATAEAICQEASTADLSGWARVINQGAEGWISLKGQSAGGSPYVTSVKFNQCWDSSTVPSASWVDCPTSPTAGVTQDAIDHPKTFLSGWAWQQAGGANATAYGVGWITFNIKSEILFPYLQGAGGDIYSSGGINTTFAPPSGQSNAQYLVHVGGTSISSSFISSCNDAACKTRSLSLTVPSTTAPGLDDPYSFKLGRFDFRGLYTIQSTVTNKNKYGQVVSTNFLTSSNGLTLGGKVYFPSLPNETDSNYVGQKVFQTTGPITINNGSVGTSGAGTVIVRGNLYITGDITYEATVPSNVSDQLASLTWIVLGDVRVAPSVKKLAGSFIVLGRREAPVRVCKGGTNDGATCTANSGCDSALCVAQGVCDQGDGRVCVDDSSCLEAGFKQYCMPASGVPADKVGQMCTVATVAADCRSVATGACQACKSKYLAKAATGNLYDGFGIFKSCYSNPVNAVACGVNPLIVSGSVFARQFKLDRTYINVGTKEGSEQFIADGRLQLNPPPGMADFAKGLPTFTRR